MTLKVDNNKTEENEKWISSSYTIALLENRNIFSLSTEAAFVIVRYIKRWDIEQDLILQKYKCKP